MAGKEQGEVRPYASAEWSGSVADLRGIVEEARKAATQAAADSEEAEDADDSRRAASQLQARAEEMKSKLDFLLDAVKVSCFAYLGNKPVPRAGLAQTGCSMEQSDRCFELLQVPSSRKDIASTVLRQVAWKMANAVADLAGEAMEEAQARFESLGRGGVGLRLRALIHPFGW